jgi:hypothetical protein
MRDLSVEIDRRRRIMTSPDRDLSPPCTFKYAQIFIKNKTLFEL